MSDEHRVKFKISDLPPTERPAYRVAQRPGDCSLAELIAVIVGGEDQLEVAHRVVREMADTWPNVTVQELAKAGVGPVTACKIIGSLELGKRGGAKELRPALGNPADVFVVLKPLFAGVEQELLYVLCLDTRNRLMGDPVLLYQGSLNQSLVRISEVLRIPIRRGSASIIVAHNHPSGDPSPSPEDVALTRAIVESGKMMDVEVLDHVIVGGDKHVSLKARGLGFG